jgi:hypothetical protein
MMRFIFRPSILIALSVAVVVGAVIVVFQRPPAQGRPMPLPVGDGEREIVWLYPATNASSWQRFVAAVRRTAQRLQRERPDIQADDTSAFPSQTTTVPQVSLSIADAGPRFVFRWYKLTGDWKTSDWIEALLKRRPAPLAIIGGSSSDSARELAIHLNRAAQELPAAERPLLLLTTATADRVAPARDGEKGNADNARGVQLTRLYPDRTFRFCFSNEQMATAVSNFIWSRDDLRPQSDPHYVALWNDDSYSRDLVEGFGRAWVNIMALDTANLYALLFNQACLQFPLGVGGGILPVQRLELYPGRPETSSQFRLGVPARRLIIDSSVGAFSTPNRFESNAAGELFDDWRNGWQNRPLLIVAGQSQPSRRFLRALIRSVPSLSKRVQIVVATGDAISFNTIYRDREVAWNIQDLPFPLVFFCHRNPIDTEAGFRAESGRRGQDEDEHDNTAETGTEDLLLFGDIVESLVQAAPPTSESSRFSVGELAAHLLHIHRREGLMVVGNEGVRLFNDEGQRNPGTGEHVVCLKPIWEETFQDRLLAQAQIEVFAWRRRERNGGDCCQEWLRRGQPLTVSYNQR